MCFLLGPMTPRLGICCLLCAFLKVELSLDIMPTDWWSISFPEYASFHHISPVVFPFFFRTVILLVYMHVALATRSDGIGNVQGLVGALAVFGFSFSCRSTCSSEASLSNLQLVCDRSVCSSPYRFSTFSGNFIGPIDEYCTVCVLPLQEFDDKMLKSTTKV